MYHGNLVDELSVGIYDFKMPQILKNCGGRMDLLLMFYEMTLCTTWGLTSLQPFTNVFVFL
jgi:hypothetical protein